MLVVLESKALAKMGDLRRYMACGIKGRGGMTEKYYLTTSTALPKLAANLASPSDPEAGSRE
jgi:hypothetical protein